MRFLILHFVSNDFYLYKFLRVPEVTRRTAKEKVSSQSLLERAHWDLNGFYVFLYSNRASVNSGR